MFEGNAGLAKQLIGILEGGSSSLTEGDGQKLTELAAENKVLLQFLRVVGSEGTLRVEQEKAIWEVTRTASKISGALEGCSYAFFKLLKPIAYVPADIDLIVRLDEVRKVSKGVSGLGFSPSVKEPYCITFTKGSSIVDVYVHPTFGNVIYLDGQAILNHVAEADFNGVAIPSLKPHAEALVVASHALYKEQRYTLNDFFTVDKWASKRTFELARELDCEMALEFAIGLNKLMRRGAADAPYAVKFPEWLTLMSHKFMDDNLTRGTSLKFLTAVRDRRTGPMIVSRMSR